MKLKLIFILLENLVTRERHTCIFGIVESKFGMFCNNQWYGISYHLQRENNQGIYVFLFFLSFFKVQIHIYNQGTVSIIAILKLVSIFHPSSVIIYYSLQSLLILPAIIY